MSVTFYDPENPPCYDCEGDKIGGGTELNLSNSNAYNLLQFMGFQDMYCGDIDGEEFRKRIALALASIDLFSSNPNLNYYHSYIKEKLLRLETIFMDANRVRWE